MELNLWFSLFAICLLGAVSPGPSLAVVMNNTIHAGRGAGLRSALAHGLGVALYGLMTVAGLAVVITRSPALFLSLQLLGAAYLLYLGVNALRSSGAPAESAPGHGPKQHRSPALDGFLVAFLNPKLAVFMLALFSQFLRPEAGWPEKSMMVGMVGITDACWYALVVVLISRPGFLKRLRSSAVLVDRVFGVILILLALSVVYRALSAA